MLGPEVIYRGMGRVPGLGNSPALGLWARGLLSPPLCPSAGSACCCWCVLPRPGSCGASSTPSSGTGGTTGMSRAPNGESKLPPDHQQGSSRGSLVSARASGRPGWGLSGWMGGARAGSLGSTQPSPAALCLDPSPGPWTLWLLPGPDWHVAGCGPRTDCGRGWP